MFTQGSDPLFDMLRTQRFEELLRQAENERLARRPSSRRIRRFVGRRLAQIGARLAADPSPEQARS